ncbi:MAG TPA: TetR/AcrR family transcriptional regulator [Nocardioides sp.]|uniref:TetR/AcrR family transcriptional regulator n=1 Tax=Nocardioides sp. TaxID=35761 RepID=UPI002F3EFA6B
MTPRTQPYHHGNLRPVLVDTAVELARSTGPDGVVLREVARRAGVSHNAAYRHFDDRAALLTEVSDRAMAQLERAMQERIDAVAIDDPAARAAERLRETGRAYVDFAVREPGLFAVAFSSPAGPEPDLATRAGPYGVLNTVLDELVEVGSLAPERRQGADVSCWATVHGYAELTVNGPLAEVPSVVRDQLLESVLEVVHRGLMG